MLTQGQPYVEKGMDEFEARRKDRQLRALQRKALNPGMELTKAAKQKEAKDFILKQRFRLCLMRLVSLTSVFDSIVRGGCPETRF